ncbi:unnamed protein product [Calypogeia fissa]
MPVSVSHGVDKLLMTVKNFGKKSASYESLTNNVQNLSKELGKMGHRTGNRSKLASCLPDDIPQGYLAVYVGNEQKRFGISTKYLSHHLFKALQNQKKSSASIIKGASPSHANQCCS